MLFQNKELNVKNGLAIVLVLFAVAVALTLVAAAVVSWTNTRSADCQPTSPESDATLAETQSNSSSKEAAMSSSSPSFSSAGGGANQFSANANSEDGTDDEPLDVFALVEREEQEAAAAEAAAAIAKAEKEASAKNMKDELPYIGMPESYIDKTWLGSHEDVETIEVSNNWARGEVQRYSWYSKNGKHDEIFTAYVQNGLVVKVKAGLSGTDYWPNPHGKPDLYASGTADPSTQMPYRPDPADYDDPEEYRDSLDEYRQYTGDMSGTYDDPYDEWELDH